MKSIPMMSFLTKYLPFQSATYHHYLAKSKKHPMPISLLSILAVFSILPAAITTSKAQTEVYHQDFDTDSSANWITNVVGAGRSFANFYWDYSTSGIPPAPHSVGGTTRGLKMCVNLDVAASGTFPAGISVSPLGFGITENFDMHFDLWLNYNKSGSSSTECGGAGYGTAGTSAQVAGNAFDSVIIGATLDGGSTADYRVYGSAHTGSYQDADHVITGDSSSPFVYASAGGIRNNSAAYYVAAFTNQPVPPAQTNLYPQQTGLVGPAGAIAFKWHDVSLKKVGKTITYTIDGVLIATANTTDAGVISGTNILLNMFDTNNGGTTNADAEAVLFTLIDNVRITNFPSIVTVDAVTNHASPRGPIPGVFTVTRNNSPGTPLTVTYTIGGTAVPGVDYTALPGSFTFDATQTTTNILVNPLGNPVPGPDSTVIMTINDGTGYTGGDSDTISFANTNPPSIDISVVAASMYERLTNDHAVFKLTRRGDITQGFDVNLIYGGNAIGGTDYMSTNLVTFSSGIATTNFNIFPIDNSMVNTSRTVTVSIVSGTGYNIGTNTPVSATIVDDEVPAETVLWSDNLQTDSSANWSMFFGATNSASTDYSVVWAYDYSGDLIPPAPHSGVDTHGLKMTVNKGGGGAAGLNFYPTNQSFGGNYAFRFDMYLIEGGTSPTEYAIFGINHSGSKTNWFRNNTGGVGAGWTFDGIFYDVEADAAALGDYAVYSSPATNNNPTPLGAGRTAATLTNIFKVPPFAVAGAPANVYGSVTPSWADVEVSQVGPIVTLTIDRTVIFSITNTTAYTSGDVMLGYDDAYDSQGDATAGVIFANARVISLVAPMITHIQVTGGNVLIDFGDNSADAPAQFVLQSASTVTGPYADVSSSITTSSAGSFRAAAAVSGSAQYYRIKRIY